MATERVQKILAQVGIASRRKAEEMIIEGQVTINGRVAQLGDKADLQQDSIKVRGKLIKTKEPPVYLAFYKPRGVISALTDPEGRPTLSEFLGKVQARVYPVGLLDFNSEGLLLLTNDGAFAERLQKMEGVPRVYHIKVRGRPDPSMIAKIERGTRVGNRIIKPHSIRLAEELANKVRIEVVFTEPGSLDIKGTFEQRGFLVESIRRTAIGQITLRGLEPGHYRFLKPSQVEAILAQPELGLRMIPERGRPQQDGQGFFYRNPTGARREQEEEESSTEEPRSTERRPTIKPAKTGKAIKPARAAAKKPEPKANASTRPGVSKGFKTRKGSAPSDAWGEKKGPSSFSRDRAPRRSERAPTERPSSGRGSFGGGRIRVTKKGAGSKRPR